MMIDRGACTTSDVIAADNLAKTVQSGGQERLQDRAEEAKATSAWFNYEGRIAVLPNGSVRLGFPGVVIRVGFNARHFTLRTFTSSANQCIDISVDGSVPEVVHLGAGVQDLTIFDGVVGEHHVEIARRNGSSEGVWDILGGEVVGGHFLRPQSLPEKKLLFIGDSITCGGACDVDRDDTRLDTSTDNGQKTYAKVLARRLNAQCHLVSYGGRGICRDWRGVRETRNAPQFYELAVPDEPSCPWNARTYIPNAIGIMLGTNDFNQGIPDQKDFVDTFVAFVEKIRRDAPGAEVFLLGSPIVTDGDLPKRTVLSAYLMEVVRRCASSSVTFESVSHHPGRLVNAHPIAEEHIAMADELEPAFKKALAPHA